MKKLYKKELLYPLFFFLVAAIVLFFPVLHRSFASDDFLVLKRVALDRVILIKGFFRPLSDITLYFNYLIGGFDPVGYYLFNIMLHGINSFLLFLFCMKWTEGSSTQKTFSFIAAILFLTYPFHNESIVWVLGRASIVANTCGMAALLIFLSGYREITKIIWVCIFYFVGLTAYESIMLLPLMVLVLLYRPGITGRKYISWISAPGLTLLIHLIIRVKLSGGVLGSYGEGFFSQKLLNYAGNIVKVTGRLFLPPVEHSKWMIVFFGVLVIFLSVILFSFFKKFKEGSPARICFFKLMLLLIIACVVPVLFGVSTRTSESDRFLYFPSYFLCGGIAFLLVNLVTARSHLMLSSSILLAVSIFFLEKNNLNWVRASDITKDIIRTIKLQDQSKQIFMINLPDELDGAFIFRLGIKEALVINGMDPSKLTVINQLVWKDMIALPDSITVKETNGLVEIPPFVTVKKEMADSTQILLVNKETYKVANKESVILYWDKKSLHKL